MQSHFEIHKPRNGTESILDKTTPEDRRALRLQLLQVLSQYGITQAKLAESASVSPATMSKLCADLNVSWTTWELIITGLIKDHPGAAANFWSGLNPETRKAVIDSTISKAITDFASEINFMNPEHIASIKSGIKYMLGQLDEQVALNLVREIASDYRVEGKFTASEPAIEAAPNLGGSAYYSCPAQKTTNVSLNIFPQGREMGSQEISELIKTTLQHNGSRPIPVDPEQQKTSH